MLLREVLLIVLNYEWLVTLYPETDPLYIMNTDNWRISRNFRRLLFWAGEIPHIIGRSDFITHRAWKNAEFEECFRQEIEGQNPHCLRRVSSDDLSGCNPSWKEKDTRKLYNNAMKTLLPSKHLLHAYWF